MDETPRRVATSRDNTYSLSIEETSDLYVKAGHPRTLRTIQRYCASGHLDCMKAATSLGDKYYVSPESVSRHIAQIIELQEQDGRTTGRDLSRQDAPQKETIKSPDEARQVATPTNTVSPDVAQASQQESTPDETRHTATGRDISTDYVTCPHRLVRFEC